jgi:3-(3-hydroxy-phenyl)propionate hydroxylase
VPIFGVRGLNNGLADAVNAGWKLAWVLMGWGGDALLDSYSPERRGATLDVFANAGKSTRFMTPPSRGYRLLRDAALSLALRNGYASGFANPRQVTPYTYADSPLTALRERDAEFSGGPVAGAPLIARRLGEGDYLLDHLGEGFAGLYFSESGEIPTDHVAALREPVEAKMPFRCLIVSRRPLESGLCDVLVDRDGAVFAGYGASEGSFYLARPDRHITARWIRLNPAELKTALNIALGGAAK